MAGKRRDAASGQNRTGMKGQYSTLMTQGRPSGSKKKDFNVFLGGSRGWPNADVVATNNLEVGNAYYPNKRAFDRVLKKNGASDFWDRRVSRCHLNKYVR